MKEADPANIAAIAGRKGCFDSARDLRSGCRCPEPRSGAGVGVALAFDSGVGRGRWIASKLRNLLQILL